MPLVQDRPLNRKRSDKIELSGQSVIAKLNRLIERDRAGRTDAEIAEASGMSPTAFSRLRGGLVPDPRFKTIRKILDALGADLCDLEQA